ncbi:MAG: peptide deformylase [Candidatus Omnitrophica bacterium]|nr:peptide deformylase [Candidatus Omnitrophota bacterium]
MAILEIKRFPDTILKETAKKIATVTDEDRLLVRDMLETMYFANGVGLAAPQVGVSRRIIVCNPTGQKDDELPIINPEIIYKKGKRVKDCEGCLSVPTITAEVSRFSRIGVIGRDLDGKEISFEAEDLLARIILHETDHLNGLLFIDRVGFFKRKALIRQYGKKMGISCVGKWY